LQPNSVIPAFAGMTRSAWHQQPPALPYLRIEPVDKRPDPRLRRDVAVEREPEGARDGLIAPHAHQRRIARREEAGEDADPRAARDHPPLREDRRGADIGAQSRLDLAQIVELGGIE